MTGRTLLGVWAHPDDQAYLSAGLMLEHTARGDRVVVITATLGEHGTPDPHTWPPKRLGARRHGELRRSLAALGVHELHLLGLEDGTCEQHDSTEEIARYVVDIRPHVIVTFGPDGMTGHPDHRAVSQWTTDAWATSGTQSELWYATATPDFHQRWAHINQQIGLWSDQTEPPCTRPHDLCHQISLSEDQLAKKVAALSAHRSQTARLIDLIGTDSFRYWWSTEAFRAAPSPATHHPNSDRIHQGARP